MPFYIYLIISATTICIDCHALLIENKSVISKPALMRHCIYAEPKPKTFLHYTFAALQELQEMQTIHFIICLVQALTDEK